jgi:uncharacterized membrane protein
MGNDGTVSGTVGDDERGAPSSLDRLCRLTDGVFAVVMVIMVVFIGKPKDCALTEKAVLAYLRSQVDALLLVCMTFFLVGLYWFSNSRQSRHLRRTDGVHTWLTLFYLAFVVILPFPNALNTFVPDSTVIQVFSSATIAMIGVSALAAWIYASRGHRLVRRNLDPAIVRSATREMAVEPGVALLSIPAAFIRPVLWQLSFALIPLIMIVLAALSRKRPRNRADDLPPAGLS